MHSPSMHSQVSQGAFTFLVCVIEVSVSPACMISPELEQRLAAQLTLYLSSMQEVPHSLPSMQEVPHNLSNTQEVPRKLSIMSHTYNLNIWELEAGESEVWAHSQLYSNFKASLRYIKSYPHHPQNLTSTKRKSMQSKDSYSHQKCAFSYIYSTITIPKRSVGLLERHLRNHPCSPAHKSPWVMT